MGSGNGFLYRAFLPAAVEERPAQPRGLAILNAMSPKERREIGVWPPDFPRKARELALR